MRIAVTGIGLILSLACWSQNWADSLIVKHNTLLKEIRVGDSLTYYQCHVEEGTQQLTTASGQTLQGSRQKYSITEKYVLVKSTSGWTVHYYTTALNVFPYKKFSGLKIKERSYWQFVKARSFPLDETALKIFIGMEKRGREATEFDYGITKYTTNQLILKHGKDFKQLVIDGDYVIARGVVPQANPSR